MPSLFWKLAGPRVPLTELQSRSWRYVLPALLLSSARVLLLISIFLPWWRMVLHAPQYPDGLEVVAYVNHLEGDVREIDGLNHYIGMRPLDEAASFERTSAVWMILAMVLLVEGATVIHNRWAALLAAPAVLFPAGFMVDLAWWLNHFGQNLDPHAPLSSSVKPFTPPVLGIGTIGQFKTEASAGEGWWLGVVASLLVLVALWARRRAYLPLHRSPGAPA